MIETLALDSVILGLTIGVGLIGMAAAAFMVYRARPTPRTVEVSDIVKNAPYHRLHNILKIQTKT